MDWKVCFVWSMETDVPFENKVSDQDSNSMKTWSNTAAKRGLCVQKVLAQMVAFISKAAFSTGTKITWIVLERDK